MVWYHFSILIAFNLYSRVYEEMDNKATLLVKLSFNIHTQLLFQVVFVFYWNFYLKKALDDILIEVNFKCNIAPSHAEPAMQALDKINCDFEKSLCNWQHDMTNSSFLWQFRSKFPHIYKNMPLLGVDNSNDFLTTVSDTNAFGERARIFSPIIARPPQSAYCLSFFYHMSGKKFTNRGVHHV